MTVYWTDDALEDAEQIRDSGRIHNQERAELLIEQFIERASKLAQFPRMGRLSPIANLPQIRELLVEKYYLIYYVGRSQVDILRVVHQAPKR